MKDDLFLKIELLEKKIQDLIRQNFELSQKVYTFEQSLVENNVEINQLKEINERLKTDLNNIKIGKAFDTGNMNNDEAKRKIEKLIKEINLCITDLKE